MTEENKNINLDPEIQTGDDSYEDSDSVKEYTDDDMYETILENDFDGFFDLVKDEFTYGEAQEIFISARRELASSTDLDIRESDNLSEVLSLAQRRARGRVMKRMKAKMRLAKRMAAKRRASPDKLKARALKAARAQIKKKLAAQRDYKGLTPSEKMAVDRRMAKVSKSRLDTMARRLLPKVRQKETERMAKRMSNSDSKKKNESLEITNPYMLAEATVLALQEKGICDLITMKQIKMFEKVVDSLFSKFNIDFKFTKHFAERMGDSRNDPCISLEDLAGFIKKIYADVKSGKNSLSKHKDVEVVLKDLQQSINIPAALEYDRKNDELTVVTKTIMRKKNFTSPNKKVGF